MKTPRDQPRASKKTAASPRAAEWTFLSNHAHVLLTLAAHPDIRMRDVAEQVGITERAVQRIVDELAADKYLDIQKVGRRNTYKVNTRLHLRHAIEHARTIGDLIRMVHG